MGIVIFATIKKILAECFLIFVAKTFWKELCKSIVELPEFANVMQTSCCRHVGVFWIQICEVIDVSTSQKCVFENSIFCFILFIQNTTFFYFNSAFLTNQFLVFKRFTAWYQNEETRFFKLGEKLFIVQWFSSFRKMPNFSLKNELQLKTWKIFQGISCGIGISILAPHISKDTFEAWNSSFLNPYTMTTTKAISFWLFCCLMSHSFQNYDLSFFLSKFHTTVLCLWLWNNNQEYYFRSSNQKSEMKKMHIHIIRLDIQTRGSLKPPTLFLPNKNVCNDNFCS